MSLERYLLLGSVAAWAVVLSWHDWRTRRLPNWWTVGGLVTALVFRLGYGGVPLLIDGAAAAAVAGAFLLLPFLLRGAGGGDVKMLGAAGAVVGWGRLFTLLWATSLAGLLFGAVMLLCGAVDGGRLAYGLRCLCDWRFDRRAAAVALPPRDNARYRVPFSIPIAIGLLTALLWW